MKGIIIPWNCGSREDGIRERMHAYFATPVKTGGVTRELSGAPAECESLISCRYIAKKTPLRLAINAVTYI